MAPLPNGRGSGRERLLRKGSTQDERLSHASAGDMNRAQRHERPALIVDRAQRHERPALIMDRAQRHERPALIMDRAQRHERPALIVDRAQRHERPARLIACPTILDLREIDFEDFEGLPYDEIATRYPDLYRQWMETPTEVRFPNGESFREMRIRVLRSVRRC